MLLAITASLSTDLPESLDPQRRPETPNGNGRFSRRQVAFLVAIGAALLALLVVAYAFSKNYEVLAEGQLLPYTEGEIARVRFFDAFTLYIARETVRPLDVITTIAFAMLAGISLVALLLGIRRRRTRAHVNAFFLVCLLGSLYLALDESLAIHETIGHNMQFLADLPGVHRPDDAIFAGYVVPALIVLVVFRDVIRSSRRSLAFFGMALGFFVLAGVYDVIGIGIDELMEPLSAACIIGGFTAVALDHVE